MFFLKQVTHGAGSVQKYAASEPKTKTSAKLRVHLHCKKVIKWSYDHLFCTNNMTDLLQIFESTDCLCGP